MRTGLVVAALLLALSSCGEVPFESALPPSTSAPEPTGDRTTDRSSVATTESPVSTSSTSTEGPAPADAPASVPLSQGPTAARLPDGMTIADLPPDPVDRLTAMTDWLEDEYPDRTSGHAYSFFDDAYDLTFNVNIATEGEARALCPFFVELTALYLHDTDHSVNLHGWILSDSGFFEEADWDRFGC